MVFRRIGVVGLVLFGLVVGGYPLASMINALPLVERGVEVEVLSSYATRSGRSVTARATDGSTFTCNPGSTAYVATVVYDPERPSVCRAREHVGGATFREATSLMLAAVLILIGFAFMAFEVLQRDEDHLPELDY
jgi:hypothetical protein